MLVVFAVVPELVRGSVRLRPLVCHLLLELQFVEPLLLVAWLMLLLLFELGPLLVEPGSISLDLLNHFVEISFLFLQFLLLVVQQLFKISASLLQLLQLDLFLYDFLLPYGNLRLLLFEQLVMVLLFLFESFLAQTDVDQW